jgi:RND family efflux transporter MFP subunit
MTKTTNLLVAAALLAGAACKPPAPAAAKSENLPVAEIKTAEVVVAEHQNIHEVAGSVEAKLRARIEAKTSGRIEAMPARLGQTVQKGELLAQLDSREIQARLDQAAATREQAETDLKRLAALLKQQALTQAEFDGAQARFRVADAAMREAETMLGYTRVLAPFGGVVVRRLADVGDLAAPGKPLLELEDPAALRFVASVPEALIASVRAGMELPVRLGSGEFMGKIAEIAPTGDPVSRTSRVELDLPSGDIRAGSFGRLLLPAGGQPAVVAPSGAVLVRGQLETIFVVRSNRAELRLVRTGKRLRDGIEILSGVSAGEVVVSENPAALRDGQPVAAR